METMRHEKDSEAHRVRSYRPYLLPSRSLAICTLRPGEGLIEKRKLTFFVFLDLP